MVLTLLNISLMLFFLLASQQLLLSQVLFLGQVLPVLLEMLLQKQRRPSDHLLSRCSV